MGMAASQARYLALVARKSNCEYEGQQINQARLNLSNQSANLFNQMLGLKVPVPPSTQDYTKVQYSYKDGILNYSDLSNYFTYDEKLIKQSINNNFKLITLKKLFYEKNYSYYCSCSGHDCIS